ncbi:MAG: type II toxin-antitoxin system RelE/ParE family toxin [Ekhidna sp.]|uniref:hypothetical protein n=1 Tax=Ekhidna sp. TaxID=2608089 RepID=UPI0032EC9F4F
MSFEIIATPHFKREIKKLSKKYKSLKVDFSRLVDQLKSNPSQGTPLGNDCFKIRMAITSKGKGKSAGARIITHFYFDGNKLFLLSIFDKSIQETITKSELRALLENIKK